MEAAFVSGFFVVLVAAVGFAWKYLTGETSAGISKELAESLEKTNNAYQTVLVRLDRMDAELQSERESRREERESFEQERRNLQSEIQELQLQVGLIPDLRNKILELETENKMLWKRLGRRKGDV